MPLTPLHTVSSGSQDFLKEDHVCGPLRGNCDTKRNSYPSACSVISKLRKTTDENWAIGWGKIWGSSYKDPLQNGLYLYMYNSNSPWVSLAVLHSIKTVVSGRLLDDFLKRVINIYMEEEAINLPSHLSICPSTHPSIHPKTHPFIQHAYKIKYIC